MMRKFNIFLLYSLFCAATVFAQNGAIGLLHWEIVEGVLVISGEGEMPDFSETYHPPWYACKDEITSVVINEGVASVGNYAFANYSIIKSLIIPSTVKTIGAHAFTYCRELASVIMPDQSLEQIGNGVFSFCYKLTSISLPHSLKIIGTVAFTSSGLTSVTIPDGVISIGKQAFYVCDFLVSITLPASVTDIGEQAFGACLGMRNFYNLSPTPQVLNNAFEYIDLTSSAAYTHTLYVPSASIYLYQTADEWKEFYIIESLEGTIPNGNAGTLTWKIVGETLIFSGNGDMPDYSSIKLPPWAGYKNIIKYVDIGEGVTRIGHTAFYDHREIISVSIPNTVETMGVGAFSYCEKLISIEIPYSVIFIDDFALGVCSSMISITVASNNPEYTSENSVLFSKDKKILVAFPSGKTGNYTIPKSVQVIHKWAFFGSRLTTVVIPHSITSVSTGAFQNCPNLTTVTLPASVTSVSNEAFYECSGLKSIIIPASVTFIDYQSFAYCESLIEMINLSPIPQTISFDMVKGSNLDNCILRVPAGSIDNYRKAAGWMEFKNIEDIEAEVTVDYKNLYMLTGATRLITAIVSGDLTDSGVAIWDSNDETVAPVNNTGAVTAIEPGTAVITASIGSDADSGTVTVVAPGKTTISGSISNSETENMRKKLY